MGKAFQFEWKEYRFKSYIPKMPRWNQLSRKKGKTKKKGLKRPQIRGICLKVYEMKPKKPNSARRNICKVKLSNKKVKQVFIPGENHNLEEYSRILIRGGRTQDLPRLKLKAIRGKLDLNPVLSRTNKRSKYGKKKSLKEF